jgi:hypothetical protein
MKKKGDFGPPFFIFRFGLVVTSALAGWFAGSAWCIDRFVFWFHFV